ncbi:ATP-binding protein [Streptomyces sp. NPDC002766]|uniref:ATP-binding protein n=1 Tax=unclassified Streptomyces TaxID=2593676 RepID=UPI00331D96EF
MDAGAAGGGDTTLPWAAPQTSLALEGDAECIARARHLAADFLLTASAEHGAVVSDRVVDVTRLVVSELVTNACKYAPGPILLHLHINGGAVEVVVWDSAPVLPAARAADAGRVGQHGLEIVTALAQRLVAERQPVGKRITARIPLTGTDR